MSKRKAKTGTIKNRQGDVALRTIEALPEGLKPKKDGKILAYGEVTGHKHQFIANDDTVQVLEDDKGNIFVKVLKETNLYHGTDAYAHAQVAGEFTDKDFVEKDVHKPNTVSPGLYQVIPQRQYNAFEREAEKVRD